MLKHQLETWRSYPDQLKEQFRFIIVDDASPVPAAPVIATHRGDLDLMLFRMQHDVPWGWPAAKNTAMLHVPENEVALSTDIDHVLEPSDATTLTRMPVASDVHYIPRRRLAATREEHKRHPASYIWRRSLYWKIGGFEEKWLGLYGSDHMMRTRAARLSRRVELEDLWLTLYGRDQIMDANTTTYGRKNSRHFRTRAQCQAMVRAAAGPVQVVLSQPYERIL